MMFLAIMINTLAMFTASQAFKPHSRAELKRAVDECVPAEGVNTCADGPNGAIGMWDVSEVTDMHGLFYGKKTFNADISKWEVSQVTSMERMFKDARAFNQDLSTWDVSSATDMKGMFEDSCAFNADISKWNVSSVKYFNHMFAHAASFTQKRCGETLCGDAWQRSQASKREMFQGAGEGSIAHCTMTMTPTSTSTSTSTALTDDYVITTPRRGDAATVGPDAATASPTTKTPDAETPNHVYSPVVGTIILTIIVFAIGLLCYFSCMCVCRRAGLGLIIVSYKEGVIRGKTDSVSPREEEKTVANEVVIVVADADDQDTH